MRPCLRFVAQRPPSTHYRLTHLPSRSPILRTPLGVFPLRASTTDDALPKTTVDDPLYDSLNREQVWLVSEQVKLPVTKLWSSTEKCVLVFARSMGCVFCQEYARQLARDVLPKLSGTGIRLFLVSIGTAERGKAFSELTGFPEEQLLADPENVLYDAVGLIRSVQRTFFDPRTPLSIFGRVFRRDRGMDLVEATAKWKPWIPPKTNQAFQQGGVVVFNGMQCTFKHFDQSTGNHMDLDELLQMIVKE